MDSEKTFERLSFDLNRFKARPARKLTAEQSLAGEIYEYFSKQIKFGQILGFIKYQGAQAIREQFEEFKKYAKPADNPVAYFIGILKKNRTVFYYEKN